MDSLFEQFKGLGMLFTRAIQVDKVAVFLTSQTKSVSKPSS